MFFLIIDHTASAESYFNKEIVAIKSIDEYDDNLLLGYHLIDYYLLVNYH